ncbi:MAG: MFS transporter [Chloroflexia bacterium]|nr:MFS transporter [Chloroflexia bacterium]
MTDRPKASPKLVLLITTLASFLTPFMSNAINLAITDIRTELGADPVAATWIVSVYLLAAAALLLPFGRVADLYGRKKIFVLGLLSYGLASALSALAGSVVALIVFRALQGIGGAMIFGTGVAILTAVFPPQERGRVLGINTAATYTGLTLGPVLGGLLTQQFGWRSIFWLNALVALAIVPLVLTKLRQEWAEATGQPFDWAGALCYGLSLVALVYGVSSISKVDFAQWLALAGLAGLLAFGWLELRADHPLLDLRRFRGNVPFVFSNLAALIHYSGTFAISFLLAQYLQEVQGIAPREAGLILLAQPIVMALLSPLAGWVSDRVEPRLVASLGMLLTAGGMLLLSTLGQNTPVGTLLAVLFLIGLGFALFSSPNVNAVMSSVVRADYGVAASTLGTMRLVGQSMSLAVVALLFSLYLPAGAEAGGGFIAPFLQAMQVAFRLYTGLVVLAIFFSLARGRVRGEAKA